MRFAYDGSYSCTITAPWFPPTSAPTGAPTFATAVPTSAPTSSPTFATAVPTQVPGVTVLEYFYDAVDMDGDLIVGGRGLRSYNENAADVADVYTQQDFTRITPPSDGPGGDPAAYAFMTEDNGATWANVATLRHPSKYLYVRAGSGFGESIAVDGDFIVFGSPNPYEAYNYHYSSETDIQDPDFHSTGAAYVFKISSNFTLVATLLPSDGEPQDEFGYAVAISGTLVVVAARNKPAYLFRLNDDGSQWTELAKLSVPAIQVAVDGRLIVIGNGFQDKYQQGDFTGAAYVFRVLDDDSGAVRVADLIPDDLGVLDFFGSAVAIDDNLIAVGANPWELPTR